MLTGVNPRETKPLDSAAEEVGGDRCPTGSVLGSAGMNFVVLT